MELIPKQMRQQGAEGLAGWVRTTWLPYTQAVPEERREELVDQVVRRYLRLRPPDADGAVTVQMVRLEVEAFKESPLPCKFTLRVEALPPPASVDNNSQPFFC